MSHASDNMVVGKIGAPYGVQGWVKVTTYTDEIEGIFAYSPIIQSQILNLYH